MEIVSLLAWKHMLCNTGINPHPLMLLVFLSIHVYQSSDNIRNRKNSMKMQHSASILCIL